MTIRMEGRVRRSPKSNPRFGHQQWAAMRSKWRFHQVAMRTDFYQIGERIGHRLPVTFCQFGLGIEQIHMTRPTMHEKLDHRLRPRFVVRCERTFAARGRFTEQRSERKSGESGRRPLKQFAAIEKVVEMADLGGDVEHEIAFVVTFLHGSWP